MLKFDNQIVLSNDYMRKQIDGKKLCKLLSKRKKLPHKALHMWKYNRIHQKDLFSKPLVHGMCTDLHNTYKVEFPREEVPPEAGAIDLNEIPPEEGAIDLNEIPSEECAIDLNEIPPEECAIDLNEIPPEEGAIDLNEIPPEEGAIDLNEIPAEEGDAPGLDAQEGDAPCLDAQEGDAPGLDAQEGGAPGLDAQEGENAGHPKPELTNEQRFGAYFALEVIKSRDGAIQSEDKELIAFLLNTSVRTVERIWGTAQAQIEREEKVDVSNKKKGNVGRKKKDLDLPRVATIPLNKRKTIRGLARSLGVSHSTLHLRFKLGDLTRHSSRLRPPLTPTHKLKRLEFCVSMIDMDRLTIPRPFFKTMDNIVHIDEKWFSLYSCCSAIH